ncbi:MAG: hypothetical protein GTN64_08680 [Candidatus Latescibacteria bacterium]|nr:hypothetical protein [Candidatus Latescibacterota bacterium]NIO78674.1 hypothetical protein [Candidatus Latescibacterota bacterium]
MTSPIVDDEGRIVGKPPYHDPKDNLKKQYGFDPEHEETSDEKMPTYAISRSDFMRLLRGEELSFGPLRRMISIHDGPFIVLDDGTPSHKITPPEPIEFQEPEDIEELFGIVIDSVYEGPSESIREKIENVLRRFVANVRGVFRGGPGSGHHGHRGRPGEVGGSLPSRETAREREAIRQAEEIGGKRGGFARTLKKIKQFLTPKIEVHRNYQYADVYTEMERYAYDWEGDARDILHSILDRVRLHFPNDTFYGHFVETEEVDLDRVQELVDELWSKRVEAQVNWYLQEIEDRFSLALRSSDEEIAEFLEMSFDDFQSLKALEDRAVKTVLYEQIAEDIFLETREWAGDANIDEVMRDIFLPEFPAYGRPEYKSPQTRLRDWLLKKYEQTTITPFPDFDEVAEYYGELPKKTVRERDMNEPSDQPAIFPGEVHVLVGLDKGEPVSALYGTSLKAEDSFRAFFPVGRDQEESLRLYGIDYENDIKDKKYLYIGYVASKRSGQGYGTEMMMKVLALAGENGWGIAGNSTDQASGFYEKLGAKWVSGSGAETGGMAFWTPTDVKRAYRVLKMIGAGEVMDYENKPVTRAFDLEKLADLFDPAALMTDDPEYRNVRHEQTIDRLWSDYMSNFVAVVRGPLRRIFVEEHHGPGVHPGTKTPQEEHAGGRGAPKPARVSGREREIAAARKVEELPLNEEVYPAKSPAGERVMAGYQPEESRFGWNESLDVVGQIPMAEKMAFLRSLPKDTRTMTADQRLDLAKVFMDMPVDQLVKFREKLADIPPAYAGTTIERNKAKRAGGIRDVFGAVDRYVGMMQKGQERLEKPDEREQLFGRNLINRAAQEFEYNLYGVAFWPDEDRDAFIASMHPKEEETLAERGGPGSGHKGHKGRPGEVGGSLPNGAAAVAEGEEPEEAAEAEEAIVEEAPKIEKVVITVGDEDVPFDNQEQYEKIKQIAAERLEADKKIEPEITDLVTSLANKLGGDMSGIEHRVKSQESLIRKTRMDMIEKDLSEEDALAAISDTVRYTMLFDGDKYVDNVLEVQKVLEDAGYQKYDQKWKNYWRPGDDYDGYNTVYVHGETGQRFELQFHTFDSIKIKKRSHEIYKELRTVPEGEVERRKRLYGMMQELWVQEFDKPEGWERLPGVLK